VRSLVWFRGKDLRIADHAPLRAAAESARNGRGSVIPLFVLDEHFFAPAAARKTPHRSHNPRVQNDGERIARERLRRWLAGDSKD
jgi:deoxyribodipyrimidine photolyase